MKTFKKMVPIITTKLELKKIKTFYNEHFGFVPTFENDSFLGLEAPGTGFELSFMAPGECAPEFDGKGIIYSFEVENVDAEHERLQKEGLKITKELEDHPWGDRSFVVGDPAGVDIYVYQQIEPAAEFKQFFKE